MSTVFVTGEALLPTPFYKTAPYIKRASCGKRADGPEFICCCGYNFGDGPGEDEGKTNTLVVEPTSETFHLSSHAQVRLAKTVIALRLKLREEHVIIYLHRYTMLHQRTPEMLILQHCRVGVEVFHAPPRRREANKSIGSEQNRSQECEIRRQLDVSEAEKAAAWRKICERAKVRLSEPP